ncbi:MAG: hypothetical protein FJY67_07850 [Calditrichaeota bacterium]|nr:hypothetical protein [Calditrichota bacterium]
MCNPMLPPLLFLPPREAGGRRQELTAPSSNCKFMFKRLRGLLTGRPPSPSLRSVLFVCTANVTRSPVAEAMFRRAVESSGEEWQIASAGVRAIPGVPVNPVIGFIMFQRQMPLTNHKSRPVTTSLMERYYWIITAEQAHRDALLKMYPDLKDRVQTLLGFGRKPDEIEQHDLPDPTGKEPNDYRELMDLLETEIPRLHRVLQVRVADLDWSPE